MMTFANTAVFDVCDTLYFSNTTHDFIRFLANRRFPAHRRILFFAVNSKISPVRYALIIISVILKFDLHKKFAARLLSGLSRETIDNDARSFVSDVLNGRKINVVHELLLASRKEGTRIVLCSSSIQPVVAAIAAELQIVDFVSTKLEYSNDTLTGRIAQDITGIKTKALIERYGAIDLAIAVSDNREDASLLSEAASGIAIVHTNRNYEFWREKGVQIIDLRNSK